MIDKFGKSNFFSGEEVGSLMVEFSVVSEEANVTKKVNKVAQSFDKYFSNGEESRTDSTSELATWMDSVLLKEENREVNIHSVRLRTKRPSNIFEDKENTGIAESSGKGKRRLVKQRSSKNLINLESDEESDNNCIDNSDENQNKTQDPREPNDENERNCVLEPGETSTLRHPGETTTQNWDVDEIEESENLYQSAVFKRQRSYNAETKPQDDGSNYNKSETEATEKASVQVSCIICWTEFSSSSGILPCGIRFCYSCIQQWADCLVSERKKTICPLCKSSFITIKKIEDAGSCDQKIYSQIVPDPSSTNNILVVFPEEVERHGFNPLVLQPIALFLKRKKTSRASSCSRCYLIEPEDLLIRCHLCNFRRIHSYCLDPYLLPWTCKLQPLQGSSNALPMTWLLKIYHHSCSEK